MVLEKDISWTDRVRNDVRIMYSYGEMEYPT